MSTMQDLNQVLSRKQAILDGDAASVEKQKKSGKLTARERVAALLDAGSFVETDVLVEDSGVVTGSGVISGRPVYVFAQDYTVLGGAVSEKQARKIVKILELARKTGTPVIGVCDSTGALLEEGVGALNAYADIFAHMARLSGVVPMITVVAGPCAGAAAMLCELSDFAFVVDGVGALTCAGAQVMQATLGGNKTAQDFGGAKASVGTGAAAFACESEKDAFAKVKTLLDLLPSNNLEDAPLSEAADLNRLTEGLCAGMPGADIIDALLDAGTKLEAGAGYTQAITALGRLGGRVVAVVYTGSGTLCAKRCQKIARFVRFADCYNIPVISLIDADGIVIAQGDSQAWMLKASSELLYTYAEATTPKIALVTGNAIGAAYIAMGGKANSDMTYAWPGSVISAVSSQAAVQLLYTKELKESKGDVLAEREKLADRYAAEVADGVNAAAKGYIDDVIDPAQSRKMLIAAVEMLSSKRDSNPPKKHGNMPL